MKPIPRPPGSPHFAPPPPQQKSGWLAAVMWTLVLMLALVILGATNVFGPQLFWGLLLAAYFAPAMIAFGTTRGTAIFLANALLGWTIVGWIVALIWAVAERETHTAKHRR